MIYAPSLSYLEVSGEVRRYCFKGQNMDIAGAASYGVLTFSQLFSHEKHLTGLGLL